MLEPEAENRVSFYNSNGKYQYTVSIEVASSPNKKRRLEEVAIGRGDEVKAHHRLIQSLADLITKRNSDTTSMNGEGHRDKKSRIDVDNLMEISFFGEMGERHMGLFHHHTKIPPIEKSKDLKSLNATSLPEQSLYCKSDQPPNFSSADPTPCFHMFKLPSGADRTTDGKQVFHLPVPVTMTCDKNKPILNQLGDVSCKFDNTAAKTYVQSMFPVSGEVQRVCHAKCEGNSHINPGCHSCYAYTEKPGPAKGGYNGWSCDNAIKCPTGTKCVAKKIDNFRTAEFNCALVP
eukprot:634010-Prymnesium_polylepis.1